MSFSVDYLYRYTNNLIRKNQAGGLTNLEFCNHWNAEQTAYQSDLLGRFQRISNGKDGLNTGLIENQTIMTKLSPFTTPSSLTVSSGLATKPSDFIYEVSIRCNGEIVVHIDPDQIASVSNSVIDPPSIANNMYYCTEYFNYYRVFPSGVSAIDLDYIAAPRNIVWGYTYDVNERQQYDPSSSVQPQWDNNSCIEITRRMLDSIGVAYSSQDFQNFGKSTINSGD